MPNKKTTVTGKKSWLLIEDNEVSITKTTITEQHYLLTQNLRDQLLEILAEWRYSFWNDNNDGDSAYMIKKLRVKYDNICNDNITK